MDTKKFLTGTLVGGIAFFFLGYLIYGMALMSFMSSHAGSATGVQKSMEQLTWWALILGNLASGATAAAVVGFFTSMGFDMVMFATSNIMDLTAVAVDIVAFTIMNAIAGGAIGAVLGMGKKS